MDKDNSHCRMNELSTGLHLMEKMNTGRLDALVCPKCGKPDVSVWFTQPMANEYRTWFVCGKCDFKLRTQNSERPAQFTSERVDKTLEKYDKNLVSNLRT